jgi:hypothetical protein
MALNGFRLSRLPYPPPRIKPPRSNFKSNTDRTTTTDTQTKQHARDIPVSVSLISFPSLQMASKKEQEAIAIKVQSSDKKKGADDEPTIGQGETKSDSKTKTTDEMSAEDLALQEALALSVERTADPEAGVVALALELMRKEIKSATSSMTR